MTQAATASCSPYSKCIVQAIIWVLTATDSLSRCILYTWRRLAVGPGRPRPGGSNPPAPKTLGIILTETNTADISIRQVARLATWCMSLGAQQIHLYDPAGHLKASAAVLQDSLQTLADEGGRTFVLKCNWSVTVTGGSTPYPRQEQCSAAAAAQDAGILEQQHHELPQQYQQHQAAGEAKHISTAPVLGSTAVTVRLLSSEDAYGPVIAAAQRRRACSQKLSVAASNTKVYSKPGQQHMCCSHTNGSCSVNNSYSHNNITAYPRNNLTKASNGQMNSNGCEQPLPTAISSQRERALQLSFGSERQYNGTFCSGLCQCQQQLASGATATPTVCTGNAAQLSRCHSEDHQSKQPPLCDGSLSENGTHELANGLPQLNSDCSHKTNRLGKQDVGSSLLHASQQQQYAVQQTGLLAPSPPPQSQNSKPQKPDAGSCSVPQQGHELQKQEGSILPELAQLVGPDVLLEPQLLLVYGSVLSLAGYPPFHTRACEVQFMGSLLRASRKSLASAIAGYCNVLQRHGA